MLTESALLSFLGGVIGTAIAFGGVALLRVLATSLNRRDLARGANLPRLDQIGIDASVLAFTVGVALAAGLLFGLIPAIQQSRQRDAHLLREKQVSHRVRGTLVVAEIAMAVMLLVGGCAADSQLSSAVECRAWIRRHERPDVSRRRRLESVARRRLHVVRRIGSSRDWQDARCHGGWLFEQPAADSAGVLA